MSDFIQATDWSGQGVHFVSHCCQNMNWCNSLKLAEARGKWRGVWSVYNTYNRTENFKWILIAYSMRVLVISVCHIGVYSASMLMMWRRGIRKWFCCETMTCSMLCIYRVIHKSMKHFKNLQQINYSTDNGSSYADKERNSRSFFYIFHRCSMCPPLVIWQTCMR